MAYAGALIYDVANMTIRRTTAIAALTLMLLPGAQASSPQRVKWDDLARLTGKTISIPMSGGRLSPVG